MKNKDVTFSPIPKWEVEYDREPTFPKEKHMVDEIENLRDQLTAALEIIASGRPNIDSLPRHGEFVKVADVEKALGPKSSVPAPQPNLVLHLPKHEDRRLIVVNDEMLEGERHVSLAIKPPIGAHA